MVKNSRSAYFHPMEKNCRSSNSPIFHLLTKCQKITIFDSFPNICQNVIFHRSPIFPKNTKNTIFHIFPYGSENTKIAHFPKNPKISHFWKIPIFAHFGDILENPILGILEDLPKYPIFGHFLENPKNAFFYPYPQNADFWRLRVRLPLNALLEKGYLSNPMGVYLYFCFYYILIIYFG